jgi:hypothetical protein
MEKYYQEIKSYRVWYEFLLNGVMCEVATDVDACDEDDAMDEVLDDIGGEVQFHRFTDVVCLSATAEN